MLELNPLERPLLRRLDVRPITQHGRQYIYLGDPLQLSDNQLLVPQPLASALAYCDGNHTLDEICTLFQKRSGYPLEAAQLTEMLAKLDDAYMLENAHYESMLAETRRLYRIAPSRLPSLAGRAYPAHPDALAKLLDGYLADLPEAQIGKTANGNGTKPATVGRGLLSPHIDYMRGGPVYAQVWKEAEESAKAADLVVMFGTDHNGSDPFTLTRQNYATPYGILPTSQPIVDALAEVIGEDVAYAGELRHRGEHSLELVAVWLHHMRGGNPCALVPILVGGFHPYIQDNSYPKNSGQLKEVLETLHEHSKGRNVLVVASGDLAHVGPAFGGEALNETSRKTLRADDEQLIQQMQAGNRNEFFEEIRRVRDGNNVCGVSPIYLTMSLLEMANGPINGFLTGYDTCPADDFDTSVVTIGGVIFH